MRASRAAGLAASPWALMLAASGCAEPSADAFPGFDHRVAVLEEELRIDPYEEDLVPIGVVAERGEDGVIALAQPPDALVRIYDAGGELLGTFGRQGDGPGEFQAPRELGWWADTLWVFDGQHGRVTVVSPELELARTIQVGHVPGAFMAIGPGEAVNAVRSVIAGPGVVLRMALDEDEPSELLPVPVTEGGNLRAGDGGVIYNLPFTNAPRYASSADAERVAVAMASLDGPDAGSFLVTVADAGGGTLFEGRYAFDPEPLPAGFAASEMEATAARMEPAPAMAAAIREQPIPSLYPPLRGLFIGGDGSLWLEQRERDEGRSYYVIAPDGEPVGTVLVQEDTRILAGTRERVWARETDELGMQSLVRYAVSW